VKIRPLIVTGHGLNCAREMALGFRLVEAEPLVVHLNDLESLNLMDYDMLVLPGGFSFGDHLGSGRALSQRLLRAPLGQAVRRFVDSGKLVWGVCNGFQTLVQMGLLPQGCTLAPNASGRFECRWVRLAVNANSPCLFTQGMEFLELPVRHGEGRLLGNPPDPCVPLRYVSGQGQATEDYPANPNGSALGAAALCDASGRIFGMMPHPEAFVRWTQHPNWTRTRDACQRQGLPLPKEGQGLSLFRTAVSSCSGVRGAEMFLK